MNIPFEKQVQALIEGWGSQEVEIRPPFVLCDIDMVYEELGTEPIRDMGFWKELDGKTYYLINSYGVKGTITGQPTGAVRWTDKQIPTEEIQKTVEILGVTMDDVIMYEDFLQRKAVESMTDQERIAYEVQKLRNEKNDVAFEMVIPSSAKGEEKLYTINLKIFNELQLQYSKGNGLAFHDDSLTLHELYTHEEGTQLLSDISKAVAEREAQYDILITRAAQGVFNTEKVFTAEEQSYIDMIVSGV